MANATTPETLPNANINRLDVDLAGSYFARLYALLQGKIGKVGKNKHAKITNNATAGNVTSIALPAGVYAIELYVITTSAIVAVSFGADTPAVATSSTAAVGYSVQQGQAVATLIVPESETTMKVVSDTNSAVVWVNYLLV